MAYTSLKFIPLCILMVVCVIYTTTAHSHTRDSILGKGTGDITGVDLISSVSLTLNGSTLQYSGQWVTLTWDGVPNPQENDTIQVFAPYDVDFKKHAPVKYARCIDMDPGYIKTGGGSASFYLLNLRTDEVVVLVQNTTIIGMTDPITFENINQPLQGHLALTHSSSIVSLTWTSLNTSTPLVKWGISSGDYTFSAPANSTTYTEDDLCDTPANDKGWYITGLIHTAYLTDLVPGQVYYYIYGDEEFSWSSEASFVGPKAPLTPETVSSFDTIRIMAYGDMGKTEMDAFTVHESDPGSGNTTQLVLNQISDQQYDAILHIGDISYAVGYGSEWDGFFHQIEPIATSVPYMVCPGNHEFDSPYKFWINASDAGGECGVPYRARFDMPLDPGPPSLENSRFNHDLKKHHHHHHNLSNFNTSNNWYSFDISAVHIVMINTEELFWPGSDQLAFIEQDLRSVDRQKTPYVILSGHRPMYIDSNFDTPGNYSDQAVAIQLREYVEPLLYKYQVDLALWGHFHAYQRTCAVYNTTCVADGTVHMVIGMAGHSLSTNILQPAPSYMEVVDINHFGIIKIEITPEQLEAQYVTDSSVVLDSVIIPRKFV